MSGVTLKRKRSDTDVADQALDQDSHQSHRRNPPQSAPTDAVQVTISVPPLPVAESAPEPAPEAQPKKRVVAPNLHGRGPLPPRPKIVKLAPARPYPTVPTSANATGPRAKRTEGNNKICVTRKTELGAYLRRCRDVIVKEGWAMPFSNVFAILTPFSC